MLTEIGYKTGSPVLYGFYTPSARVEVPFIEGETFTNAILRLNEERAKQLEQAAAVEAALKNEPTNESNE